MCKRKILIYIVDLAWIYQAVPAKTVSQSLLSDSINITCDPLTTNDCSCWWVKRDKQHLSFSLLNGPSLSCRLSNIYDWSQNWCTISQVEGGSLDTYLTITEETIALVKGLSYIFYYLYGDLVLEVFELLVEIKVDLFLLAKSVFNYDET